MDIKKSISVALAKKGMTRQQLADLMGVSRTRVYAIAQQKAAKHETIEKVASALEMKVSEFIALGEGD
ncbi:hypothetical protein KKJFFJLC_00041 [Vibrio phage vB_VpaS_PGB]|nr:hypothetical protein HHKILHMN_00056 [Vibrio phage vB_VpaS_PGA]WVH05584.1 hypothetical protein KKJFFJLC_00041 [Vibrio phage vB_VpaS_PGB]